MSEKTGYQPELIPLYDVLTQRDEFLATAKALENLFANDPDSPFVAEGRMTLKWQVPEGYHIEVSHKDGRRLRATTMFQHKDYASNIDDPDNDTVFDAQNPLEVHQITAIPTHGESLRYELRCRSDGLTYDTITLFGKGELIGIDNFNILPAADLVNQV